MRTGCIAAFVKNGHGLISRPGLNLHEICTIMAAFFAVDLS